MENEEVDIFVITDNGKKYIINVKKSIPYRELFDLLSNKVLEALHFYVIFQGKIYKKGNENDILNFNQGDEVIVNFTVDDESYVNAVFHLNAKVDESDKSVVELSGILQLCLLKYIAKNMNDSEIKKITSEEIKTIISNLQEDMDLSDNPQKDIKANLSQKAGKNIMTYINYIKGVIKEKETKEIIELINNNKKDKIMDYWSQLSKYEDFNQLFEDDFKEAMKNSYFDYSLIGISIYQQENRKKFIDDLNKCKNRVVKLLFHGTQIDPISKIITGGFLYTRKAFYGMGIYFSDMLDYIAFYSGGTNFKNRRKDFGITVPANKTFSCVATEIFYDKSLKEEVFDYRYYVDPLDHFPTYEELKQKYKDKMVEKNGIHFARVEPEKGHVLKSEDKINKFKKDGKFIGNEYVITEKEQMLPLYGLTLKRNEYFVIWRDPNFQPGNRYYVDLIKAKKEIDKSENVNVFIEISTEKALELINKKKFNKIILISSVGLTLSGKTFVETARKILGFDVMVLFFSRNIDHKEWIQNFPNALYTNKIKFCQKYVENYNEQGLLKLKKEVEGNYNITLKFTKDFLKFPKYVNEEEYCKLIFKEVCPNFRKVIIINRKQKKKLVMNEDKTVQLESQYETEYLIWYITIINGEMTLFSKDLYLYYDEKNKKVGGYEYIERWNYEQVNGREKYYIYYKNKNNTLTVNGENVLIKKRTGGEDQLFDFIDDN